MTIAIIIMRLCQILDGSTRLENKKQEKRVTKLRIE